VRLAPAWLDGREVIAVYQQLEGVQAESRASDTVNLIKSAYNQQSRRIPTAVQRIEFE
jgi:hypothetical protein